MGMLMDFGPCCACGMRDPSVRNVVMLDQLSPTPGRGWGCAQCGLPCDGALAVVCDACLGPLDARGLPIDDVLPKLRVACRGYPSEEGRVPIGELTGRFAHDPKGHSEEWL